MSSEKQIEANRRNAQKSKGPRTATGKARASRNSRKHALCTISRNNPHFAPRIDAIAREICSEATNAELWEQALIIGECTTLLACAQAERIALIEQLLGGRCVHIADTQGAGRAELGAPREFIKDAIQPNFNFWQNEAKSCGTKATPMFGT